MKTQRRQAYGGCMVAAIFAGLVAVCAAAGSGRRSEEGALVRGGVPHEIAACMLDLRLSRGECEVGAFTGTYPAAWDTTPDLVPVRDAVRAVQARGGRWTFGPRQRGRERPVCAMVPGQALACAADVRAALGLTRPQHAPGS